MSTPELTERSRQLINTIAEAVALEAAGGTWKQKHAAAIVGYSPSFLRSSDCPKGLEQGDGIKGRNIVVYIPAEVRAWKAKRFIRMGT